MTASPHLLQGVDPRLPCSPERRCFACLRWVELEQADRALEPWAGWRGQKDPETGLPAPSPFLLEGEDFVTLELELSAAVQLLSSRPGDRGLRSWWEWARSRVVCLRRSEGAAWLFYSIERLRQILIENPHPPEWLIKDISLVKEEVDAFALAHDLGCSTMALALGWGGSYADLRQGVISCAALRLLLAQPRSLIDRLLRAGAFFYASTTGEELEALACKLEARGGF